MREAASAATMLPTEIQGAGTGTQICVCSTGEMVHFFMAKLVKLYSSTAESFSSTAKGRSYVGWFFQMVRILIFPNTNEKRDTQHNQCFSVSPQEKLVFELLSFKWHE